MVLKRFEALPVNVSVLGEELTFPSSKVSVQNRFLKASMSESLATYTPQNLQSNGLPTERLINLYSKWGHGQFGLILTGNIMIDHDHLECPGNIIISKENESTERNGLLMRWTEAIKSDGALSIAQIGHAGRQTQYLLNHTPFAPSAVQLINESFGDYGKPIALSLEQIQTEVIDRFVYAAKTAHEAGFAGVQIHGAHGYLLAQFLAPNTNERNDKYGGDAEKRAQILIDIHDAVRREIPASTGFVVGIKLNSVEFQRGGLGLADAITTATIVDKAGYDFIEFSGGNYESWQMCHQKESTKKREAFFVEFCAAIKPKITNAVVYLTGGFRTAPAMIRAIEEGSTDGIGLGRPITAEPDLPKKIISGEAFSAPFNKVDADFFSSHAISRTQLGQAGNHSWEESEGNPSFGIMDVNDDREFDDFFAAFSEFAAEGQRQAKEELTVKHGVCSYRPKYT